MMPDDHGELPEAPDDPRWRAFERALRRAVAPPPEPDWSRVGAAAPRRANHGARWLLAAAACALLTAGAAWWGTRDSWTVRTLAGSPRIHSAWPWSRGLAPGARLETGPDARARLEVDRLGTVDLDPGSRLRRLGGHGPQRRLALETGRMHAFILAPPRQFVVETPSAVATDLGCAYTLEVEPDGTGALTVQSGWVAFERGGRETFVPAGARCLTRRERGPGTPFYTDAPDSLIAALAAFDAPASSPAVRASALGRVLAGARPRDAFTLWHLLARVGTAERGRVADRLAELVPPPAAAGRAEVLALEPGALDAWWDALGMGEAGWWRMWEGDAPEPGR